MEPGHAYRNCKKPACGECGEGHHMDLHGKGYVALKRRKLLPKREASA